MGRGSEPPPRPRAKLNDATRATGSGLTTVRMPPALHVHLHRLAAEHRLSLNAFLVLVLSAATGFRIVDDAPPVLQPEVTAALADELVAAERHATLVRAFGAAIALERTSRGLTRLKVAERSGLTVKRVEQLEEAPAVATLRDIRLLSRALDVPPSALVARAEALLAPAAELDAFCRYCGVAVEPNGRCPDDARHARTVDHPSKSDRWRTAHQP